MKIAAFGSLAKRLLRLARQGGYQEHMGQPDFRDELKAARRRRKKSRFTFGLWVLLAVLVGGIGGSFAWNWVISPAEAEPSQALAPPSVQLPLCNGMTGPNCVVDGDTIWLKGRKIRIADIDAPEVGKPQCEAEYALGMKATYRLQELLNLGPFEVQPIGKRDQDRYGRDLRVFTRAGRSIGDLLVSEGLARTWTGAREPWC